MRNSRTNGAHDPSIRELMERHHSRYEVHPYYVVFERRPVGAAPVDQRVQTGFEVEIYGVVDKMQFPRSHDDEGRKVVEHIETVAKKIQSKTGHDRTTVEVIPSEESLVLDVSTIFSQK